MSYGTVAIRVLLVCVGGITTTILAKRIQEQLLKSNKDIKIEATSFSNLERVIEGVSLLLIAPQAKPYLLEIKKIADKNGIPFAFLPEEALTQNNYNNIFNIIFRYYRYSVRLENNKKIEKFSFSVFCKVVLDSIFALGFVLAIGALLYLLNFFLPCDFFKFASDSLNKICGLFLIFSLGYHYAVKTNRAPMFGIALCLTSCLIWLTINNSQTNIVNFIIEENKAWISLDFLGIKNCPLIFVSCILTIAIDQILRKFVHIDIDSPYVPFSLNETIYISLVMLFFFFLRIIIAFSLS